MPTIYDQYGAPILGTQFQDLSDLPDTPVDADEILIWSDSRSGLYKTPLSTIGGVGGGGDDWQSWGMSFL